MLTESRQDFIFLPLACLLKTFSSMVISKPSSVSSNLRSYVSFKTCKNNTRNENKTHLVKFGSLSNTESLTQETKTSHPVLREFCS